MPREEFQKQIKDALNSVLEMSSHVDRALDRAMQSLIERDVALAQTVVDGDSIIDELNYETQDEVLKLLAQQAPLATDLRVIVSVSSVMIDLERMGDEAAKIARSTTRIFEDNRMSKPRFTEIKGMAKAVQGMIKTALNSFARLDLSDTIDILEKDKQVDDDYRSCMRQLLTFMLEDPRTISMSLESMFIAKSLERIGDHAVNISQSVIYTVKGKDVRHSSLKEIKKELS